MIKGKVFTEREKTVTHLVESRTEKERNRLNMSSRLDMARAGFKKGEISRDREWRAHSETSRS